MKLSKILKQCNTNFHCENFFDFNVFDISSNSRIIKNNFILGLFKEKKIMVKITLMT